MNNLPTQIRSQPVRLALGTAPLRGPVFDPQPVDDALRTLQHALDRGLNFIDTAPFYGDGETETLIGQVLAGRPRNTFTLQTKAGRLPHKIDDPRLDFSKAGIRRSLENSLKNLGVDFIDRVLIHDPDDFYREALDNALPVLHEFKQQGLIGAVGAGMNQWQMLADFARHGGFDCFLLAGRYTLLEQGASELLTLCAEKEIEIMLGGVFNGGILATGAVPDAVYNYAAATPEILQKVQSMSAICARYGVPLATAALRFAAFPQSVTALVVGLKSTEEVDALLANWNLSIPADLWLEMRAQGLISADAPLPNE